MGGALANEHARRLRDDATSAERRLWSRIRLKQLNGHRFRRQHPLGKYIADFVCLEQRLVVELDGGQHAEGAVEAHDTVRTAWLQSQGYRVIRFWNRDVLANIDGVLEAIDAALES